MTAEHIETRNRLSKALMYTTIGSGVVAAYLMYPRGESTISIDRKSVTSPVGSLVSEIKNTL
jgi:hypothetical protein